MNIIKGENVNRRKGRKSILTRILYRGKSWTVVIGSKEVQPKEFSRVEQAPNVDPSLDILEARFRTFLLLNRRRRYGKTWQMNRITLVQPCDGIQIYILRVAEIKRLGKIQIRIRIGKKNLVSRHTCRS